MTRYPASRVLGWVLALAPLCSAADPGNYLVTVYDHAGETDVSFRYWTVNPKTGQQTVWPEIGVGYGVTNRWYTKVFASYIGPGWGSTTLDALNWQNDYLLTQGQYPFDLALHTHLTLNRDRADGKLLEFGPVLQTDVDRVQINTNLIFAKTADAARPSDTQLKYQWQLKYRWQPKLQFGLQGFGELGNWNRWSPLSQQAHRAGPVLEGTWVLGNKHEFRYQAALLAGKTYGQRGTMFTTRIAYAF